MPTLAELAASEPKDDLAALAASEPQDDLASLAASEPSDDPANVNVGVMPMPSRAEHLAALRAAPTDQDTAPGAYTLGGPSASAFQATERGLTGQQAGEALQLSKATGFSPDFAADNAADLRTQADRAAMTQGLARSPVLAGYAAQSSVHASAIQHDLESMTAVEYWLTGKWQDMPGPAPKAAGPYALAQTSHEEMVAPPVWQSGLAKFAFGVAGGLLRIKKATVGLTPEQSRTEKDVEEAASGAVPGAGGGGIRGAGAMATEMVPALILAPGTKPAQAAYFTLQAFPGYYRTLGEAVDEHGAPRFSDFEAKTIAGSAAIVTGVGSALLGSAFLKAIPGAASKLNGLLGESIVQAFVENPTLAKVAVARVVQVIPHMASGVAMMTASGAMNGGVKALADGHSPLSPEGLREIGRQAKDGSETGAILSLLALYGAGRRFAGDVQRVRAATAEGPQVVPPEAAPGLPQLEAGEGPTIETTATREGPPAPGERLITDLGRAADSATEAAQLDGMVTSASASGLVKNAPQEAQRLFALMAQQGPHDTVYVHQDAAKDEAVARAIDGALGDGGQARALAEAQGPGGMIAVPIEKYLTQIAPDHHEAIREHVRLSPDGMTPAQSREALPDLQGQLSTLPSDEEAKALVTEPPKPDTLGSLMAARDYALQTEPDTPERTAKLQDLEARMRKIASRGLGMPDTGKGTPEEVAAEMAKLEAELAKPSAAAPPPPPPDRSAQYAASAKITVNALPIRQIHPGQFALAARQASDRLAKTQAEAVERLATAEQTAQEGLRAAVAAATGLTGTTATKVITPQNLAGEPATYRLVEASKLVTSHTPTSFEPDPRYPANVQERDYRTELGEQAKVARGGRFLDPALVLAETPTAVDGPPLVTSGGKAIVLGGNGRSMMLLRAYEEAGESAQRYREELRKNAPRYGIDPQDVDAMKQPVLVRSIDAIRADAPRQDLVAAVRRYNEGLTQHLSPRIRAVAEARVLSERTVSAIGELLGAGDASLRDVLRSRPQDFLAILERDGVVNAQNRAEWTAGGELTDEAKDRIEGMFLGRVMGSGERLQATAPSVSNKVERAVPALLRVEGVNPAQSEIGDVQGAVDLLNEAKGRGLSLNDLLAQQTMFKEGRVAKRTIAVARLLEQATPKEIGQRFKAWADTAAVDPRQGGMFGGAATPADALGKLFEGLDVDFSGKSRPADSAPEPAAKKGTQPVATRAPSATPIMSDVQAAQDASVAATGQTVKAGEHMAEVERIAHERDFSRALAKEAAAVKLEMDRELASIQKIASDREIRGQLGLAHPAFRGTFDAIAEAVGASRPQPGIQRQTVDQLLQVLNDKNLPAPFDEGVLKDIVADPRPWKDLTPVEARQSANAAASIVKMGLDLTRVAIGNRKLALVEAKANVVAENALRKDLGAPPATLSARGALDVADAGLSSLNAWNLKPEVAMQTLGKTMHGVFLKTIDGRNYLQKLQGELLTNLMENVGEIGWIKEPLKSPSLLRMPRIGDPVLAPRPVTLPKTLAAKYGNTPAEWEALLNDKALPDLPPAIRERLEKVMEEWKHAQTVHSMPDLADKFNKETMAMLFMNLGSASNEQRLTSGYNWSGQTIRQEIGKHLTLEQVDQLQGVLSLLDKQLWPLVKEHAERTTGLAPPKIQAQPVTITFADGRSKTYEGGYFPAAPHPDAIDARAVDKAAYAARATVAASFIKERAERASYPLDLNWRRVGRHIDSVLHYLAYDEPVRDISKLLDDGTVQMVVRHSLGDANLTKLTNWRDTLAVGRVDNTGPMAKVMGKTLRSRAVTNALSLNLPIAYMQASHIPFAVLAGEISAKNATLAAGKQVPFTQQWIDLRNEMTELQFRSTRWAEQYRTMMAGETSLLKSKTAREIDHYAFLHMEAADAVVSHIIADAALNDAIEQGMDREAAREYANAKVRLLMPTHNVFEMSALGRNPGFVGTVSLFRGLSSVVWNVNYNLFDKSRQARFRAAQPRSDAPQLPQEIDMEEAPDGTWGMKAKANMYSAGNLLRMFSASAVLGTLGYLLAGHGKNKDDKRGAAGWGQWAARTAAGSELEGVPGGRDLAQPFIDAAVQRKSLDWALEELKRGKNTPEVAAILSYLTDLGKMVSRRQTTPQKIQAATNATLAMAGIGVRPVTAMGVNAVQGNPKMRRPRGVFDRLSQFVYPTRTYEKTWLNGIEDFVTGRE